MSATDTILTRMDESVRIITINRPRVRNAIDTATMRALGEVVATAEADAAARVLIITGAGDIAFSAGGDMAEMRQSPSLIACDLDMRVWQDTLGRIERLTKPVIAAVNGYAYGGGTELAMACHIRVCGDTAQFGQTEIRHDHLPGAGGTQRLPRLIPLSAAYELLLTGDSLDAAGAYRLGLVSHVWPTADMLSKAIALAKRIAQRSPIAVQYTLEAVAAGLNGSLETGLRIERAMAALVMESGSAQAGLNNFLGKTGP
ncbi:MAG TPA: enoyl-CoA hydratase/isomerase family protein [Vineibacter sp.]|nr:enoyl-CoA hydratase/isomerase family protein [Vineibacter sp.]